MNLKRVSTLMKSVGVAGAVVIGGVALAAPPPHAPPPAPKAKAAPAPVMNVAPDVSMPVIKAPDA